MSAAALYDDQVMDHIRNARNYRALEDADRRGKALSQVCGDSVQVYLKLDDNRIAAVGFQCESCGICMASASMMTELLAGRSIEEAQSLMDACARALDGADAAAFPESQRRVFTTLQAFPARKTCAWVGWAALGAALRQVDAPVSL